jgi:undecaprenyl-diphosphatase
MVYITIHITENTLGHLTLSLIGVGLLLQAGVRFQGSLLLLLGLGIAWGKIYMGIYFPMEILGLIIVGFIAALLYRLMRQ